MAKRAQLSVETMIMYGLILLVALSVVGVLLYFNVIDLGSYLPSTCDIGGSGDLQCEEYQYVGTTIQLGIKNIGQKPIESISVTATDSESVHFAVAATDATGQYGGVDISTTVSLPPGGIATISIPTVTSKPGLVFRGTLKTTYKFKGGALDNVASGSMRLKVSAS
jgi:hypothetical protein